MPGRSFRGATVVASQRQVSTQTEGEVVILNFDAGVYYGLDEVGARIWEIVSEPVAVDAICDRIVSEFDVDPARCEADLESLLGDLADAGLIEVADADPE